MSSAKIINSSLCAQGQASAPLLFFRSLLPPTADKGLQDDPQKSRGALEEQNRISVTLVTLKEQLEADICGFEAWSVA